MDWAEHYAPRAGRITASELDFATFAFRGAGTLRAVQAARAKIPTS
jgi:hypothetical protein